ncbi:hypothetical protein FHS23_001018 [Prauserella isguenensis]|uniref:Uncharacterized protein n=1 Tax=Prauserella isguenensis TaxID=1470180 RepID=A0A839RY40_9PSEU|nr:hypothetical protein [Prauserella isguenensis]
MPKPSFGRLSGRGKSGSRRRDDADTATPRTAAPAGRDDTDDHAGEDQELSSYLKALAPDNDVESTGSGRKFGEAQVHQLRMTHAAGEQLTELAEARGTSPQALALEWVLERLAWEAGSVPSGNAEPAAPGRQDANSGFPAPHAEQAVPPGDRPAPPDAPVANPDEHTDPRGHAVPPIGATSNPRHAAGPGHVEPEARTDEHFFDRTGWDAPHR